MFLFLRMVLAHFIADYPLQTNKIYGYKIRCFKGQLFHANIHLVVFALFLIPYWHHPAAWVYLICISLSHLLIDILKVQLIDKTQINPIFTYTLDQVLHILAAAIIFFFPFANEVPAMADSLLLSWYWNDAIIIYLIGLLVATYFTTYFIACWEFYCSDSKEDFCLTSGHKFYGIVERGLIMSVVAYGGSWFFLIPLIVALRLPIHDWLKKKGKGKKWLVSIPEMMIGTIISVLAGLLIRVFVLSQS